MTYDEWLSQFLSGTGDLKDANDYEFLQGPYAFIDDEEKTA
ncbi:hypothetical protein ABZV77_11415 [Streptomyces sp. NPDC004732]